MSLVVSFGIALIQIFVAIYDFLTIFIYFLIQRPWRTEQSRKDGVRAMKIYGDESSITYQALPIKCSVKERLKKDPSVTTMASLFKHCVKIHGSRKCLGSRKILGEMDEQQPNGKVYQKLHLGEYTWQSYTDVQTRASDLGKGLRSLGIEPKQKIVVYANTCADWMTTAIASFQHSISIVTIYTNLGEEGVAHGITQTNSKVVVASEELIPRLLEVLPSAPFVNTVIIIPSHKHLPKPEPVNNVMFYTIEDVVLLGKASSIEEYPPDPEDTAIIMYTSGSTGVPKGVVLTHKNILQALYCLLPTVYECTGPPTIRSSYMGYLPLAHILELLAENTMIVIGIPIGYGTTNTLLDTSTTVAQGSRGDVTELSPTVMCAVPLVLDRIYKGLQAGVKQRGLFTHQLVDFCYRYRLRWIQRGYGTPIMDRLIFKNLRAIVGGQLKVLLSGGAPLAPDAHQYCRTVLGVTLLQGYGLTETAATATIPDKYDFSTGLVGPPLQEVDIRLINWEEGGYKVTDKQGPRGEIIVGGEHVAKEYFNMPDKTDEEFFDDQGKRWFKTGDIGHIQENGTLKIIDRKKDLVKLQGGEYVSLGKVESILKIHPMVDNVCIYADPSRINTVALVVPDEPALIGLAKEMNRGGMNREQLCADSAIIEQILKSLQKHGASQKLAKFEIPKAIYLVSEMWTPESGLVTAAMKLKRKSIENAFKDEIAQLYEPGEIKTKKETNNNTPIHIDGVKSKTSSPPQETNKTTKVTIEVKHIEQESTTNKETVNGETSADITQANENLPEEAKPEENNIADENVIVVNSDVTTITLANTATDANISSSTSTDSENKLSEGANIEPSAPTIEITS